MTFKINDGDKTVSADIEVSKNTEKGKVRLHLHYADPKHAHLRVTALLDPYAARQVAVVLKREADTIEPPDVLWPTPTNAQRERMFGVHDAARATKPGHEMPGLSATKLWSTSYTKKICDALPPLKALTAAHELLKDYWESMHRIYEDRDQARAELGIIRTMRAFEVAGLRDEIKQLRGRSLYDEAMGKLRASIDDFRGKLDRETKRVEFWKRGFRTKCDERNAARDQLRRLVHERDELRAKADHATKPLHAEIEQLKSKCRDLEESVGLLHQDKRALLKRIEVLQMSPQGPRKCACGQLLLQAATVVECLHGNSTISHHSWKECNVKGRT